MNPYKHIYILKKGGCRVGKDREKMRGNEGQSFTNPLFRKISFINSSWLTLSMPWVKVKQLTNPYIHRTAGLNHDSPDKTTFFVHSLYKGGFGAGDTNLIHFSQITPITHVSICPTAVCYCLTICCAAFSIQL